MSNGITFLIIQQLLISPSLYIHQGSNPSFPSGARVPIHYAITSNVAMDGGASLYKREELPLFGKWFDETHHPELVEGEGRGEIF